MDCVGCHGGVFRLKFGGCLFCCLWGLVYCWCWLLLFVCICLLGCGLLAFGFVGVYCCLIINSVVIVSVT